MDETCLRTIVEDGRVSYQSCIRSVSGEYLGADSSNYGGITLHVLSTARFRGEFLTLGELQGSSGGGIFSDAGEWVGVTEFGNI
jgi:hypothetical protein